MPRLTLAIGRPTLADEVFDRRLVTDVVMILAGAALVALSSQLTIPLWPVPITAQTLAVLFVGASLGAVRGALSLLGYVGLGALGLPVFSGGGSGIGALTGSTGGFIAGFVLAAGAAGFVAHRGWDRRVVSAAASLLVVSTLPFVAGLLWLGYWLGEHGAPNDPSSVVQAGLYPFVLGEIIKVAVTALVLRLAWRSAARARQQDPDAAD